MSAAAEPAPVPSGCLHCGLPVPRRGAPTALIEGVERPFCCLGCRAVAELIVGAGHTAYYARRELPGVTAPDAAGDPALDALADDPEVQRSLTRSADGALEAVLALEGARCAACAWLIERHLSGVDGVVEAQVSVATARARVVFRPEAVRLSAILQAIREVGYGARPHRPSEDEAWQRAERRASLRRLGVAGLGTMQVMMFAVGLYAGDRSGIAAHQRDLLRYASLIVATFVVVYSARPFFAGAWQDLRARAPGMDVPVALAIAVAYGTSAVATVAGAGAVYFESACMFTFLLGLTRHLEMAARQRRDARIRRRLGGLAAPVWRLGPGEPGRVEASALRPGDRVRLEPGDPVPADGVVATGGGAADESLVTGEPEPRRRGPGDALLGGSRWLEGAASMEVERAGAESSAARIAALLERAQLDRPPAERLADRIASRFVVGVLVVSAAVFAAWLSISPGDAVWVTLSVLVATCPCALSLATPAALASASAGLAERGFLICRGRALETLERVTHVVFDKTGTLTHAEHRVVRVLPADGFSTDGLLGLARALEAGSGHPIASAFRVAGASPATAAEEARFHAALVDVRAVAGRGIEGDLSGDAVRIGRPDWVAPGAAPPGVDPLPDAGRWIAIAVGGALAGWIAVGASVRREAGGLVADLAERRIGVSLLSGDPDARAVDRLADAVGIASRAAGCSPEEKLESVSARQAEGHVVAVVGDGMNDAPVMGRADVSIAMGGGADLARVSADAVLLGDRLDVLRDAWAHAARTRAVLRQNLGWAIAYNLAVLPAAAAGLLAPWMAALGMSASSLLVVGNSLRLRRVRSASGRGRDTIAEPGRPAAEAVWASA